MHKDKKWILNLAILGTFTTVSLSGAFRLRGNEEISTQRLNRGGTPTPIDILGGKEGWQYERTYQGHGVAIEYGCPEAAGSHVIPQSGYRYDVYCAPDNQTGIATIFTRPTPTVRR